MTVVIWADANVHDSIEVPEPVTMFGDTMHATLLGERLTSPLNPLTDDTLMVEVPADPAFTWTDVGLAAIVKSVTFWVRAALVLPLKLVSPPYDAVIE